MTSKPTDSPESTRIMQEFEVRYSYPVVFTRAVFDPHNLSVVELIENRDPSPAILPAVDSNVLRKNPTLATQIEQYFNAHHLTVLPTLVIDGGEACKQDDRAVQRVYQAVVDHKIDRHSYIVVVGGGAVIDAVGYAAATAHRGIRLIRVPTTVLAQNDAAVGVKNAINLQGRKNFLGTFVPPHAVVCDFELLETLESRDKRAGIAEAIKVALIKDKTFFNELFSQRQQLASFERQAMENMIIKGARWHLNHIAGHGDPFESGSARPLDFGHWSAHKLEELTNNELRHGEAVAIGIAIDAIYSHRIGRLAAEELDKIIMLLSKVGFKLQHPALDSLDIGQALHEFKEHLGGKLCITVLDEIGSGVEVNEIDVDTMRDAIDSLLKLANAA